MKKPRQLKGKITVNREMVCMSKKSPLVLLIIGYSTNNKMHTSPKKFISKLLIVRHLKT